MNFGTLFSGGEGVGVGLTAAGLHHAWGVEYDADIAAVARRNGFNVHVADVRSVDYSALPRVDWLHASPVCTRASVANANATEAQEDIDTAAAVVRALEAQQPAVFTLENVWQYRTFAAFRLICDTLGHMGYFWTYDHCNAADYGVPQTRRRLILRASRGLLPLLPAPVRWVGWYEAIADLLPTLPESRLAPWQLARLPEELRASVLVSAGIATTCNEPSEPAFTIVSDHVNRTRAVLINESSTMEIRTAAGSAAVQVSSEQNARQRAVLVAGLLNSESTTLTTRNGGEPAFTVTTSHNQKDVRAWTTARVVAMTPRCLARFQSLPDTYILPDKRALAARVIGNMVPPLLMQRIAEGITA